MKLTVLFDPKYEGLKVWPLFYVILHQMLTFECVFGELELWLKIKNILWNKQCLFVYISRTCYLGQKFALRARISVFLILLPISIIILCKGCTLICHFTRTKAYLFSLDELYFLKCAISTHNFLKPEWIHSRKTTIRRKSSIFPNILSP